MLAGIFVSPVAHVDTHIFVSLFFSGKNALFTETCRSCRDRRWVDFKLYLWYVCANSTYWLWWFYAVPRVLLKILRFRNLSWGPKKKSNPCDPRTFPPGDLVPFFHGLQWIVRSRFCLLGLIGTLPKTNWKWMIGRLPIGSNVWYICLHLVDLYGKCR